jgi:hypothetical protein
MHTCSELNLDKYLSWRGSFAPFFNSNSLAVLAIMTLWSTFNGISQAYGKRGAYRQRLYYFYFSGCVKLNNLNKRQEKTGKDRKRQEKTGKDRKWQEMTGKDRKWQEMTGNSHRVVIFASPNFTVFTKVCDPCSKPFLIHLCRHAHIWFISLTIPPCISVNISIPSTTCHMTGGYPTPFLFQRIHTCGCRKYKLGQPSFLYNKYLLLYDGI